MYANGFLQENRRSPVSLAAVIGLHGAAIAVLALYGTTQFIAEKGTQTKTFDVPIEQPPPPLPPPPPPQPDQPLPQPRDRITTTPPVGPTTGPIAGPETPPEPYRPPVADPGPTQLAGATVPRIPVPVRRGAEVDPRFRDALQPPYPPNMERLEREGQVRVRITIGTDGRVTSIEQLSSADEAFWRVTQRQALSRWRFRPATVDGRPVVSTMVYTVNFRLPEA
jgi:protein TonB